MIEGTKPYRGRARAAKFSESSTTNAEEATSAPVSEESPAHSNSISSPDAANKETNLGRRDWFRALVPALGNGLVEILRTSNHLKRDLHEKIRGD